jgi:hypothetical protein
MRTLLSNQEFKTRFSKLTATKATLDQELQVLLEDALFQASHPDEGGSGSCNRLDHIVTGLAGQRSWPIKAIRTYISEHTAAKWVTLSDGRKGYSYQGNAPSVTMPTQTWWEHKASNENSKAGLEIHVASRINALFRDAHKENAHVDDPELLAKMEAVYKQHVADKKAKPEPVDDFDKVA